MMDAAVADTLNREGFLNSRGSEFSNKTVHLLRLRWMIRTVKITGADFNPPRLA